MSISKFGGGGGGGGGKFNSVELDPSGSQPFNSGSKIEGFHCSSTVDLLVPFEQCVYSETIAFMSAVVTITCTYVELHTETVQSESH